MTGGGIHAVLVEVAAGDAEAAAAAVAAALPDATVTYVGQVAAV